MKNILFIVDYYYPKPSPNTICVSKVIEELKIDNKIFCITADKVKANLEVEEINGIEIHRVKKRLHYVFIEYCNMKIRNRKNIFKLVKFIGRIVIWIKNKLYKFVWPIMSYNMINRFVKKSEEIIINKKIDTIVAVSYPFESLKAASIIKRKYPNINCLGYFLDVTSIGDINKLGIERSISIKSAINQEKKVLSILDGVIILENAVDIYKKNHRKNFEKFYIANIPLIQNMDIKEVKYDKKEKYNIVYTGSLDNNLRNPIRLIKVINSIRNDVKYDFFGNNGKVFDGWSKEKLKSENIKLHGFVREEEADKAIDRADCVLSLGNSEQYLIPSKIFKYMNYKKKIIHIAATPLDPCIKYLENYPYSLIMFKEDLEQNNNLLKNRINNFLDSEAQYLDELDLERLYPKATPKFTASIISNH